MNKIRQKLKWFVTFGKSSIALVLSELWAYSSNVSSILKETALKLIMSFSFVIRV